MIPAIKLLIATRFAPMMNHLGARSLFSDRERIASIGPRIRRTLFSSLFFSRIVWQTSNR